jgi:hypothetical protein
LIAVKGVLDEDVDVSSVGLVLGVGSALVSFGRGDVERNGRRSPLRRSRAGAGRAVLFSLSRAPALLSFTHDHAITLDIVNIITHCYRLKHIEPSSRKKRLCSCRFVIIIPHSSSPPRA